MRVFLVEVEDDTEWSPPSGTTWHELDVRDLMDGLPPEAAKYLTFEFGVDDAFSVDFGAVIDLLDYVDQHPVLIAKVLMQLQTAVANLFHRVYDELNEAREHLESHVAQRTAYFANTENELPFKRTKDNIDKMIQSEQVWKNLRSRAVTLESNKSKLRTARQTLEQVREMAEKLVEQSPHLSFGESRTDRGFGEVAERVIANAARLEQQETL